jgi:acyl-CoA thioesterase FadM
MNLWFRMLRVLLAGLFGRRLDPLADSAIMLRVWPTDLDVNLHMNNGRYLTVMDLGRFDLIIRSGLGRVALAERWTPLLGGVIVKYRRPLAPFVRFRLVTRIAGWDEKWIYLEQRFEVGDEVHAIAYLKAVMKSGGHTVTTDEVIRRLGLDLTSPQLPDAVGPWLEADQKLGRIQMAAA